MAASPSVVALPWYARGDYPALLKLFSDSHRLPATYDAWLESSRGDRTAISECRFRCRQDLDSTHSLCGLVQGAEHLARSSGAPDFRERGRATSTCPALKMHLRAVVMRCRILKTFNHGARCNEALNKLRRAPPRSSCFNRVVLRRPKSRKNWSSWSWKKMQSFVRQTLSGCGRLDLRFWKRPILPRRSRF